MGRQIKNPDRYIKKLKARIKRLEKGRDFWQQEATVLYMFEALLRRRLWLVGR